MDLKKAMAINLRRERQARELTQEELADRAGLSARYLGSIERATVSASVTVLGRLAQALRIDPCDLIRGPQRGHKKSDHVSRGARGSCALKSRAARESSRQCRRI
jgi:transcriptional regulator with XRE-family HTH domain